MSPVGFFTFLIFTLLTLIGIFSPLPYSLLPVLFVFIGIPLVDAVLGVDKNNPSTEQEKSWKSVKIWGPALYIYVFTHFVILGLGSYQAHIAESIAPVLLLAVIVGLYTGGLGITVGHELCHKKEKLPSLTADILLASVWYQHFAVEHVRGHHLRVSTPNDPASARYNENVYQFLIRTITGSFTDALSIDKKAVFKGIAISVFFTSLAAFFGVKVFIFFLVQAVVAIILLELVNYVEHYGLSRKQLENGRYEKVLPIHSWNSAHKFSNLLLFNLQRHSDHHSHAHLPYTVLKHHENAPQLPSGYPGMIMISLIPSIWFRLMNPRIEKWKEVNGH